MPLISLLLLMVACLGAVEAVGDGSMNAPTPTEQRCNELLKEISALFGDSWIRAQHNTDSAAALARQMATTADGSQQPDETFVLRREAMVLFFVACDPASAIDQYGNIIRAFDMKPNVLMTDLITRHGNHRAVNAQVLDRLADALPTTRSQPPPVRRLRYSDNGDTGATAVSRPRGQLPQLPPDVLRIMLEGLIEEARKLRATGAMTKLVSMRDENELQSKVLAAGASGAMTLKTKPNDPVANEAVATSMLSGSAALETVLPNLCFVADKRVVDAAVAQTAYDGSQKSGFELLSKWQAATETSNTTIATAICRHAIELANTLAVDATGLDKVRISNAFNVISKRQAALSGDSAPIASNTGSITTETGTTATAPMDAAAKQRADKLAAAKKAAKEQQERYETYRLKREALVNAIKEAGFRNDKSEMARLMKDLEWLDASYRNGQK